MDTFDPTSPETSARCYCGQTHELGEYDCWDCFVGWIDGGTCWESVTERDVAITVARFSEAWFLWNRCGGILGTEPNPEAFALEICFEAASIDEAIRECQQAIDPEDWLNQIRRGKMAVAATWN